MSFIKPIYIKKNPLIFFTTIIFFICLQETSCQKTQEKKEQTAIFSKKDSLKTFDTTYKTIHLLVALCDNKYQGIVPVPPKIGNGQDPNNNLYWNCGYGVKAYFKKSKDWKLIKEYAIDSIKLERLVFKHQSKKYYLIADAYNGKHIKQCTLDFLNSACGKQKDTLQVAHKTIGILGNSQLITYIGHDGLMDFDINNSFINTDALKRDVIILACYSKNYFSPHLQKSNVNPLVWSRGLMAPEAYIIHDAIMGYTNQETPEQIRTRAINAYAKFQKCSEKAARNLLQTGW